MPQQGLDWLPRNELMRYEEMKRICALLIAMGIRKIRITGGEPFVRKGMLPFLDDLSKSGGLEQLTITTNGVLTAPLIPALKKMGIRSVNLSLDTLDEDRFVAIAKRNELSRVLETLDQLLYHGIEVKINTVVMEDYNIADLIPLVRLTKSLPLSVRFIEEMPFNGGGDRPKTLHWNHVRIFNTIKDHFPDIQKIYDPPPATANSYHIPGHRGNVGIIAAYSRIFCGSCNRIRITARGVFKTCLYDGGSLNVKDIMRSGVDDEGLETLLKGAILKKAKDGFVAAQQRHGATPGRESMATIGG
jgi:cyclic pyranopterin phosphate synthase